MRANRFLTIGLIVVATTFTAAARADSLLEKVATTILADQFGIDTREVVVLRDRSGGSVYDLAPVYETAHYCHAHPSTVWDLRRQGLGWGQIAQRLGMHPGTFNKLRNAGAFDRDRFWTSTYRDRFGVTDQQVSVLRRGGGSLEDVLGAIIVGKLTNRDPQTVYDAYKTERSWATIGNTYNVRYEDWRRVSKPVKTVYSIKVKQSSAAKGNAGRAVGHSNKGGPAKVSGNSKAKGNSQGRGNAGSGKGNGKGKGGNKGKGKGG